MLHKETQMDWELFYQYLNRKVGLNLHQYKAQQLQRRILSLMQSKRIQDAPSFIQYLDQKTDHLYEFLDHLAINVTEMFRNPEKWNELEKRVLPELIKNSKTLKCWSAGCSYGAEAYSLSMILDTNYSGFHKIIGTDIDQTALNQARSGIYKEGDIKAVPPRYRDKYLKPKGEEWHVDARLKRYVQFSKGNLLEDKFDTGYDLIICRNVVIYFTLPAQNDLYQKFFDALKPGGYLFIGGTERVLNADKLGFEKPMPFFYKKSEKQIWESAS